MRILFVFGILLPYFTLAQKDSTLLFGKNIVTVSLSQRLIFNEGSYFHVVSPFGNSYFTLPNLTERRIGISAFVYKDNLELGVSHTLSNITNFNGFKEKQFDNTTILNTGTSLDINFYPFGVRKFIFYPKVGFGVNRLMSYNQTSYKIISCIGSSLRWKTNVLDFNFLYALNNRMMDGNLRFQKYWIDIGLKCMLPFAGKLYDNKKPQKKTPFVLVGLGYEYPIGKTSKGLDRYYEYAELSLGVKYIRTPIHLQVSAIYHKNEESHNFNLFWEVQRSLFNSKIIQPYLGLLMGAGSSESQDLYAVVGGSGGIQIDLNKSIQIRTSLRYMLRTYDFYSNNGLFVCPLQLYWSL